MMGWFNAVIESRTLRGWAIFAIVGAIATVTLLALEGPSFAVSEDPDSVVNRKLNELRKATDKYRVLSYSGDELPETIVDPDDPTNIYVRPERCVQIIRPDGSRGPAMGYHYVNRDDVNRALVNPSDPEAYTVGVGGDYLKPEALLYGLAKNDDPGELKLVAVEWIVRDVDQDVNTHNPAKPQLVLGKTVVPFNGPMGPHEAWMPVHYDLHAWIWEENPTGMFQDFNPNVSCP